MKSFLLAVECSVPAGQEELFTGIVQDQGLPSPVFYTEAKTHRTTATIYLTRPDEWTREQTTRLRSALKEKCSTGWRIRIRRIQQEDWANSWKKSFRPLEFGSVLRIQGTWSKQKPKRGQVVIQIDPGLSFGTGQHPTTSYCLEELVRLRHPNAPFAMLDAGCGSAILALSARRLGFRPVMAVENDPVAVRMARRNLKINGLSKQIRVRCADLRKLPLKRDSFGLICANLTTEVLLESGKSLSQALSADGSLVLAGILNREFPRVLKHFESLGLKCRKSRREKEWRSATFFKNLR